MILFLIAAKFLTLLENNFSDDKETAVCNLASIGLPMFVKDDKTFDYEKL